MIGGIILATNYDDKQEGITATSMTIVGTSVFPYINNFITKRDLTYPLLWTIRKNMNIVTPAKLVMSEYYINIVITCKN